MAREVTRIRKVRVTAATRRRINLRNKIWPEVKDEDLWNRSEFTGFTTIPRTLSLTMRVIDSLDKKSASRVYFDLWCRSFDDYVIEIKDEFECAYSAGYDGQRAVRSWRERVDVLDRFGFTKSHKAPHGAFRLILILDPHSVIEELYDKDLVEEEPWLALQTLMITIGHLEG